MNKPSPNNLTRLAAANVEPSAASVLASAPAHKQALLAFCKASADQLRLDVLQVLGRESYGVLELCAIFNVKQSSMSHHLKILANASLVTTRREGNSIFYRRSHCDSQNPLSQLQLSLHRHIDNQAISQQIQQRVNAIHQERANCSKAFFADNADKFRQQQEQIAAYDLYGPNTMELISRNIDAMNTATVLEIGPGEGAFLIELAPRFQHVYAIDNSQAMLNKAAASAENNGLENVSFIHSDTSNPILSSFNASCIVVNMVLHHTPSPADIFSDLAKALDSDGQLFVTDLCHHDQDWVKDSCGDLWLGFEPEDLTRWANDAGFTSGENIFLAQRNGFQVQIRQFIKM
jgi:ubiquinone/menaquinone biosynthesis C-methylase UbiE/DNA-binding transcriptional ArsR family regulator